MDRESQKSRQEEERHALAQRELEQRQRAEQQIRTRREFDKKWIAAEAERIEKIRVNQTRDQFSSNKHTLRLESLSDRSKSRAQRQRHVRSEFQGHREDLTEEEWDIKEAQQNTRDRAAQAELKLGEERIKWEMQEARRAARDARERARALEDELAKLKSDPAPGGSSSISASWSILSEQVQTGPISDDLFDEPPKSRRTTRNIQDDSSNGITLSELPTVHSQPPNLFNQWGSRGRGRGIGHGGRGRSRVESILKGRVV
ncbi:hypothetical protein GYMLUDRAFT_296581 [Collybiopsis luxurians FD-317 M1]|nr:hypothetical protein GYMLUDRAFT_296581 [Collybiopsis luxurians FD-317 M1]